MCLAMELQAALVENLQDAGEKVGTVIHVPSPALGFARFSSKCCSSFGSNFSLVCEDKQLEGSKVGDWSSADVHHPSARDLCLDRG